MDAYVLNPKTGRMIAKNGQLHRKLLREGLFAKIDKIVLAEIPEGATDIEINKLRKELDKDLPKHSHSVRGRGKHKGKVVIRQREIPHAYFTDLINDMIDKNAPEVLPPSQPLVRSGRFLRKPIEDRPSKTVGRYKIKAPEPESESESESSSDEESESDSD